MISEVDPQPSSIVTLPSRNAVINLTSTLMRYSLTWREHHVEAFSTAAMSWEGAPAHHQGFTSSKSLNRFVEDFFTTHARKGTHARYFKDSHAAFEVVGLEMSASLRFGWGGASAESNTRPPACPERGGGVMSQRCFVNPGDPRVHGDCG